MGSHDTYKVNILREHVVMSKQTAVGTIYSALSNHVMCQKDNSFHAVDAHASHVLLNSMLE